MQFLGSLITDIAGTPATGKVVNFDGVFVGEHKRLVFELLQDGKPIDGTPIDGTLLDLLFDLRRTDNATDYLFEKEPTLEGVYNADRTLNTQRAVVTLTSAETDTLKPRIYRYSLKRMDAGAETILAWGDFHVGKVTGHF